MRRPLASASGWAASTAASTTGPSWTGRESRRSLPAMIRDTSSRSSISLASVFVLRSIMPSARAIPASSIFSLRRSCDQIRMAPSGVRSSCEIMARNSSLARLAASASARAAWSCLSACSSRPCTRLSSSMSVQEPIQRRPPAPVRGALGAAEVPAMPTRGARQTGLGFEGLDRCARLRPRPRSTRSRSSGWSAASQPAPRAASAAVPVSSGPARVERSPSGRRPGAPNDLGQAVGEEESRNRPTALAPGVALPVKGFLRTGRGLESVAMRPGCLLRTSAGATCQGAVEGINVRLWDPRRAVSRPPANWGYRERERPPVRRPCGTLPCATWPCGRRPCGRRRLARRVFGPACASGRRPCPCRPRGRSFARARGLARLSSRAEAAAFRRAVFACVRDQPSPCCLVRHCHRRRSPLSGPRYRQHAGCGARRVGGAAGRLSPPC